MKDLTSAISRTWRQHCVVQPFVIHQTVQQPRRQYLSQRFGYSGANQDYGENCATNHDETIFVAKVWLFRSYGEKWYAL
jgi:hypothetical protein